jgi:predicted GIY-YIG superfamily endonuclease
MKTQKTCVYRAYSGSGELLYVGMSTNFISRISTHLAKSAWAMKVARFDVKWFESREDASKAEILAIRTENPAHNVQNSSAGKTENYVEINALIDLLGRNEISKAIDVRPRRVDRARGEERLPASWWAGLCELAGYDLPRQLFTFKGDRT